MDNLSEELVACFNRTLLSVLKGSDLQILLENHVEDGTKEKKPLPLEKVQEQVETIVRQWATDLPDQISESLGRSIETAEDGTSDQPNAEKHSISEGPDAQYGSRTHHPRQLDQLRDVKPIPGTNDPDDAQRTFANRHVGSSAKGEKTAEERADPGNVVNSSNLKPSLSPRVLKTSTIDPTDHDLNPKIYGVNQIQGSKSSVSNQEQGGSSSRFSPSRLHSPDISREHGRDQTSSFKTDMAHTHVEESKKPLPNASSDKPGLSTTPIGPAEMLQHAGEPPKSAGNVVGSSMQAENEKQPDAFSDIDPEQAPPYSTDPLDRAYAAKSEHPPVSTDSTPSESGRTAQKTNVTGGEHPLTADSGPTDDAGPLPDMKCESEVKSYVDSFIATKGLSTFFDPKDPRVESIAKHAAAKAEEITRQYQLEPELTAGVVKLAFYDFAIVCDDSTSMNDEDRIPALKDTLGRVAEIATLLEPKGISIRFLNYTKDGSLDNLKSASEIQHKARKVKFKGVTQLGTVLREKIVKPKILQKVASGTYEKPLITVIITDGEPTWEQPDELKKTIRQCKLSRELEKFGEAATVFIVSRVGSSSEAEEFLYGLETDEELKEMVFCSKTSLDKERAVFQRTKDNVGYTKYVSLPPASKLSMLSWLLFNYVYNS
ncbi:hypothetical protein BDY21DRAFT_339116 [Lineolata rhizophorae]|uniref:VWFA domain-containing protein n=1 Tax=Lineolata rhizophorae TaxID=578093 RepID=A0A6A6P4E5_9PEZI|nr:hypothetical protein BDY21DRAFT_339116 [Lineolata rhizophorae]